MALVPLSTRRLLLRGLVPGDLDAVFSILGDEETAAGMSWRLRDRTSAAHWLAKRIATEREADLSMWGIESLSAGELIGLCGFFPHAGEAEVELGYVVKAPWWGDGYATEAAQAAVGAAVQAGHRVYATIRTWNNASMVVAVRAGLQVDGEVRDDRGTLIIYRSPERMMIDASGIKGDTAAAFEVVEQSSLDLPATGVTIDDAQVQALRDADQR